MRVTVKLSPLLVDLFPGSTRHVGMEAATVSDAIDELERCWPGMRDRICDTRPSIRKHMNVFVDGERSALSTTLREGAEVFIITAISGG
ncbi:MoaD/ThiS family protein [Aquamicrobium zhengzhouense]|uniref:MoaD/ThiS family protein n=1 Tax=Aquamicrobium zhengzhouense TaxID=2781738 RepID=A0ABS0SAL9_9HYPH|nr:MoaD/ThiS family protein [Aquamicrobium zhengzhouense]MBI1620281.1 MoaD/ThiS family protein [Aquamicrobium zhengzhouense]